MNLFSSIHRYLSFFLRPEQPAIFPPERILFLLGGHLSELIAATSIIQSISKNFPSIELAIATPQPFVSLFQSDSRLSYLFPLEGKNTYSLKWDANVLQATLNFNPNWIISLHPNVSNLANAFWSVTKFGLDHRPTDSKGTSGYLNYLFTMDDFFQQKLPELYSQYFQLDQPKLILSEQEMNLKKMNWKLDKSPRIILSAFRSKDWDLWYDLLNELTEVGFDVLIITDNQVRSRILPNNLENRILNVIPESDLLIIASIVASSNLCISTTDGVGAIGSSFQIPTLRLNSNRKQLWLNDSSTTLSNETTSKKREILNWINKSLGQDLT